MFCPNCGTQNPEAAQTCSKCGFHLRGAAAPKFKGTMLMMNQPGASPPAAGAAPVPRPPGAAPLPSNKLKGTMVGVAPPQGLQFPPHAPSPQNPPQAPVPQGPPPQGASPQGPRTAAWPEAAGPPLAPAPPGFRPGVNPLGGTVVADQNLFAAPRGTPGAPDGAAPPYGPPPGYGQPSHGFGGPVNPTAPTEPYGPQAAPYPPYGSSPAGYTGQQLVKTPVQGMPAYGSAPPNAGIGTTPLVPPVPVVEPTTRDARMTFLRPGALVVGGFVAYVLFGLISPLLSALGWLVLLAGAAWYALLAIQMATELKSVTKNESFFWWPIFVPFYNLYWAFVVVPEEVAKAKRMAGVQAPVRPLVQYVLMWPFALASDINDLVRPGARGALPSSTG